MTQRDGDQPVEKDVVRQMMPRFAALEKAELQSLAALLDRVRTTP